MTITFPQANVRTPDIKRYAVAGIAILAAAASLVGIQAATNDSPVTRSVAATTSTQQSVAAVPGLGHLAQLEQSVAANPGQNVTSVTGPGYAYVGLAQFAETNGLSGLSPASLGPVTTAAAPEAAPAPQVSTADQIHLNRAAAVGSVDTGSYTPETNSFFLGINDVSPGQQPTAEAETFSFDGSVAWLEANGWLPQVEAANAAVQSRSNFASDLDWINANDWTNSNE